MLMKTNFKLLIPIVFVLLTTLMACNKYEEGPSFSLLSVNKRITGTWELKETLVNDQVMNLNDMLAALGNMDMDTITGFDIDLSQITVNSIKTTFQKDGSGNFYFAVSVMGFPFSQTQAITWKFDSEKENVIITIESEDQEFEIIRLTNKELWLKRTETIDGQVTVTEMRLEKEKD